MTEKQNIENTQEHTAGQQYTEQQHTKRYENVEHHENMSQEAAEQVSSCKKGTLYGVSVGPGDPELLTLKAVSVLRAAQVIAVPNIGQGRQTAYGIIKEFIQGKPLIDCSTPMLRDHNHVMKAYEQVAQQIAQVLDEGKNVAYAAIGDIGVYSTYYYLHEILVQRGYKAEVIPGVTSFCASAARLGIPLCEGAEALTIVPVIAGHAKDAAMALPGTKVFMKSGKELAEVRSLLEQAGMLDSASLVVNCGLDNEAVYPHLAQAPSSLSDYFTLVIAKDNAKE